jgi:putative ABC transport system permease protein
VVAGPAPVGWRIGDPALAPFSGDAVPVRMAAGARVLPVLGRTGVLVDLESAQRVVSGGGPAGVLQVWLAPRAGTAIVGRLRAAGLTVVAEDTLSARERRLAGQGPAAAARFALLAAAVGLLLAAAALSVAAAAARPARTRELVDLRTQGLPAGTASAVGYAGYAALVVLGVLAGVVATVLARAVADVAAPLFVDGWSTLPDPGGLHAGALGGTVLAAVLVLGATAWRAGRALAGAVRRR